MAGKLMRRKMGFEDKSAKKEDEEMTFGVDRIEEDDEAEPIASGKGDRKVRINDKELGPSSGSKFGGKPLKPAINLEKSNGAIEERSRSRGKSAKSGTRSLGRSAEVVDCSPRR